MKKAVLVVSFGTSYKETREKAIKPCEELIAATFKNYDFYRAYTSDMIIKKISRVENIKISNPIEVLDSLLATGYEEVVVQMLHVICGEEYCKLREQVTSYENRFKKIVLGRPLLSKIEDYNQKKLPVFIGTVKGYPEIDEVIARLRKAETKKAYLMPFMLVAGNHALKDIVGDEEDSWKSVLEENPAIRQCFLTHALEASRQ